MFIHAAAATPGEITGIDTHWQAGQGLTKEPPRIVDGLVRVPERPGVGLEPDLERIEAAGYDVYRRRPKLGKLDYLVMGWRALRM